MADYKLSFTAKEIDDRLKKLDNIQSDYEQNDSSADNYIKNRPFYTGDLVEVELFDASETTWDNDGTLIDDVNYIWETELPLIGFEEGKTYAVSINNTKYSGIVQNLRETIGAPFDVLGFGDIEAIMSESFELFTYAIEAIPAYELSVVVWKGPEPPTECKIYKVEQEIKKLDPIYLPEGGVGYEEEGAVETIIEEQTVEGFTIMEAPIYVVENPFSITLIPGEDYIVVWDGAEYEVTCASNDVLVYLGNPNYVNMQSGGDIPFTVLVNTNNSATFIATESTDSSHTIEIKSGTTKIHQIDEKFLPILQEEKQEMLNTIFKEQTFEIEENYTTISNDLSFEEGKTYAVTFNGEQYSCVAWYHKLSGGIAIGNGSFIGMDDMGDDVPFTCLWYGGECDLFTSESGIYTIEIEIITFINKIDPKYLPEGGVGYTTETVAEMLDVIAESSTDNWSSLMPVDDTTQIWGCVIPKPEDFSLTLNNTYSVKINGIEYTGQATDYSSAFGAPFELPAFGDVELLIFAMMEGIMGVLADFNYSVGIVSEEIHIYYKSSEIPEEFKIYGIQQNIHKIDMKYMPLQEGGYGWQDESTPEEIVLEEQTFEGFEDMGGLYGIEDAFAIPLTVGNTYVVTWDGVEYEVVCETLEGVPCIGNTGLFSGISNDIPFLIGSLTAMDTVIYTDSTDESHIISIIKPADNGIHQIDEKFLPIFQEEKQKTFDVIFEEQTFEIEGNYVMISNTLTFEEGKTYAVTFNGEQYSCVAWYHKLSGGIAIGNGSFIDMDDMGEAVPFTCLWAIGECGLYASENGTYIIKIEAVTFINKIDPKYLPDNIGNTNISKGGFIDIVQEDGSIITEWMGV